MSIRRSARLLPLSAVGAVFILSCDEGITPIPDDGSGTAVLCPLAGTVFRLGSDDAAATLDERIGWTRFEHDVLMDSTEMTQAEYKSLMGSNPSVSKGDSLPVTNVSWFDAVLAANARSRRDGFDTVYEYLSIQPDGGGNASNIVALSVHLDRNGWRLPTEAEWEAVARAGTNTLWPWGTLADSARADAYAWYQRNSGGRVHPVAKKSPNTWGLHDMAGNVMEWVNDWKGSFPRDTVEGFAGQESPGDVPEAPLKGGAYTYGLSNLRPSSRKTTYVAYRSSRAEYVGFRLARGAFKPRYLSPIGVVVEAPPVKLFLADVARTLGVIKAQLVFVNRLNGRGVLGWIDFGESDPVVRTFSDPDPVFHPSISPDGKWVVWSTAMEGSLQQGRIKARRLVKNDTTVLTLCDGAIPRWWVDGTDTFLVASDPRDNTTPSWSGTATRAYRWSKGTLSGERTWIASGSYHDGRSGSFLYTGYRRLRQYDLTTGRSRVLFTAPKNGKRIGDTSQVCNVSVAPDGSGRTLFLDFGYTDTSKVVGSPYGIHEVAFLADTLGNIRKTFPVQTGKSQWDQLEWSNSARWAVGCALEPNGAYKEIHLLDVTSGHTYPVLSGEDVWMPHLWVSGQLGDKPTDIDPDSAAQYNSPRNSANQEVFASKAVRFWQIAEDVEVMLEGNSRIECSVQPSLLSFRSFNWGYWGGQAVCDSHVVRDYVLPHCKKLRAVVLSLEPGYMFRDQHVLWNQIAGSVGYQYDKRHGFWRDSVPPDFKEIARSRTWPMSVYYDSLGEIRYAASGWGTDPPALDVSGNFSLDDSVFGYNWNVLEGLIRELDALGLEVVLLNFPQSPYYRNTSYAGRYGPTWAVYDQLIAKIFALESLYEHFHFLDLHKGGDNDFTDDDAINEDHLAYPGGVKVTRALDSVLVKHLGR